MATDDLIEYYNAIVERGWATWVHGMMDNFVPVIPPNWEKLTLPISVDRQVTLAWDRMRFTEKVGDQHTGLPVFRNNKCHLMLFPVLVA